MRSVYLSATRFLLSLLILLTFSVNISFAANYSYSTSFGSFGTGDGQLDTPNDVLIDSNNNLYVADYYNNRIQKFDIGGSYVSQFGVGGTGDGQFIDPSYLAFDPTSNYIYISDATNNRIQKFDIGGSYVSQFGSYGTGNGEFDTPLGMAVDQSGNIYVVDSSNNRIQKFDIGGSYVSQFGVGGSGDGELNTPVDIAFDQNNQLLVSDNANNRIQKFDIGGSYVSQFGSYGSGDGQFQYPSGMFVDNLGNIYVSDGGGNRVQIFNSNFDFVAKIGTYGSANGEFDNPNGIGIGISGDVYVADTNNHRIQVFTLDPTPTLTPTSAHTSTPTPTSTPPANAPIAHWSLDNLNSGLSDDKGLLPTSVPSQDIGDTSFYELVSSDHGSAVLFHQSASINTEDALGKLSFSDNTSSFRVEAYVKIPNFLDNIFSRVVTKALQDNSGESWFMGIDNGAGVYCSITTSNGNEYHLFSGESHPSDRLIDNQWNKIACSYDSATGELKSYINDIMISSGALPSNDRQLHASNGKFMINPTPWGNVFNGQIDEVSVYNRDSGSEENPTITLQNNTLYSSVSGTFDFSGTVSSTNQISRVVWRNYNANQLISDNWQECDISESPFICHIPTPNENGRNYYEIRAVDNHGLTSTISKVNGTFDTTTTLDYWLDFNNLNSLGKVNGIGVSLGSISLSGAPELVTGEIAGNSAISFNGTTKYTLTDPNNTLDYSGTSDNFSVTVHVKPITSQNGTIITKLKNTDQIAWGIEIQDGHAVAQAITSNNHFIVGIGSSLTALNYDQWNKIVFTWDATTYSMSLKVNDNPSLIATWSTIDSLGPTSDPLIIGSDNISSYFQGELDEVIIRHYGDSAPPEVSIERHATPDRITTLTPTFHINFSDATGIQSAEYLVSRYIANYSETLDQQPWTSIISPDDNNWGGDSETATITIPEGVLFDRSWVLYIRATDSNGNKSLYDQQVWVAYPGTSKYIMPYYRFSVEATDSTPPQIFANPITPNPTIDREPAIRGYVKDFLIKNEGETASNITKISYSLDGGAFIDISSLDGNYNSDIEDFYIKISGELSLGAHSIQIRAVDASGNTTATNSVGADYGDYLLNFTIVGNQQGNQKTNIIKDINFTNHDVQDTIFSDAVWGNGVLRLHQSLSFNSTVDFTLPEIDIFGTVYGDSYVAIFPSTDGNMWVIRNDGNFLYYDKVNKTATQYSGYSVNDRVSNIFEFNYDNRRYLLIKSSTTKIVDINNTPNEISDDTVSSYHDQISFNPYAPFNPSFTDTREGGLAIFGIYDGAQDEVIRVDTHNTIMDLSDDTVTVWGADDGLATDINGNNYVGGATAFYFDQTAHKFIVGDYSRGIYICDDNNTPSNKSDDICSKPFGHTTMIQAFSIIKDPNDWYWIGGNNGLARFKINGTVDQSDDEFATVWTRPQINGELVSQLKWIPDVYPTGPEIWALTRSGHIRGVDYNNTYDDSLDDTTFNYQIPQSQYNSMGASTFYFEDRNTVWSTVAGIGVVKTEITHSYVDSNIIEIYPNPPSNLLEVDHVTLSDVVGGVSPGSSHELSELVTYEISNDAGVNWKPITLGTPLNFTNSDYKLKLRITLHKGSTPIINSLRLSYSAQPAGTIATEQNGGDSNDNNNSDNNNSGNNGPGQGINDNQYRCTMPEPKGKLSVLYGAQGKSADSILLSFTEADGPKDHYTLVYGTKKDFYQYGAVNIGNGNARTYLVKKLKPNTKYYFRVQPANGCAPGGWSNELSATTKRYGFIESVVQSVKTYLKPSTIKKVDPPQTKIEVDKPVLEPPVKENYTRPTEVPKNTPVYVPAPTTPSPKPGIVSQIISSIKHFFGM